MRNLPERGDEAVSPLTAAAVLLAIGIAVGAGGLLLMLFIG